MSKRFLYILFTIMLLSQAQGYEFSPLLSFGGEDCAGEEADDGKFCEPRGIYVDSDARIYVTDTLNNRVQIFEALGQHNRTLGSHDNKGVAGGGENGTFEDPEGMAFLRIDENTSKLYVADTRNDEIDIMTWHLEFSNETNSTQENESWSYLGEICYEFECDHEENFYFNRPKDIVVDSDGRIYIANTEDNEISIINSDFEPPAFRFNAENSTNGKLNAPGGIAVDALERIYVSDTGNNMIRVFTDEGEEVFSFGTSGTGEGEFNSPGGLDIDPDGNIYVADTGNSRIQVFNPSGGYIEAIGSVNCSNGIDSNCNLSIGSFCQPYDLVVEGGALYVLDTGNNRVQMFLTPYIPVTTTSTSTTSTTSTSTTLVSTTSTIVIEECIADANGDGKVGYGDLLMLAVAYGNSYGEEGYNIVVDFNLDQTIDYQDLLILAVDYGSVC